MDEWAAQLIPMGSMLLRTGEPFLSVVPLKPSHVFYGSLSRGRKAERGNGGHCDQ